jgi:hypothetical protein
VERDLVEPGNPAQPLNIVGDDGMIGAEHGTERMGALLADLDAFLVEVVAEDVDAVGAGQVVELVAVEIGERHPRRRLHERAGAEVFADQAAILERHPVGLGELQVRDMDRRLRRHLPALGEALLVEGSEPEEAVLALACDFRRRAVGAEEIVDVEFVMRNEPRHPARHLGVPGKRAVLGPRQLDPGLDLGGNHGCGCDGASGKRKNRQ